MSILITGGAGYIGSHTCLELLNAGHDLLVLDNFSNSSSESLRRVGKLTNKTIKIYEGDIRKKTDIQQVFTENQDIHAVIHFAGLKAVGESVTEPLRYYENNVGGTIGLCQVMAEFNCKTLVFSSSATVYGDPKTVPITEEFPLSATNPYGRSKLIVEEMLRDLHHSDSKWNIALLRYFNPVGAHSSGEIGEDPCGIPNNLMPYIAQVAVGKRPHLNIFGNNYPTKDGSGVRDYIHVVDLAIGHIKALQALEKKKQGEVLTINLGTGSGYSVIEMVKAFEKASNRSIPYVFAPRRSGDIAECYADPHQAYEQLNWQAQYDINAMCTDTWRWQSKNPDGYKSNQ